MVIYNHRIINQKLVTTTRENGDSTTFVSPTLQAKLSIPILGPPEPTTSKYLNPPRHNRGRSFPNRNQTQPELEPSKDDSFDNRLYQVRLRSRSGTGKKTELRKRKKGKKSGSRSGSGWSIFLPPVPLKEALSEGLSVVFGFSSYAERIHGRLAILGLCALLSVELATGQGVISYHSPAIILIQLYFVAAVSALHVKCEKEKISVWP